MAPRFNPRTGEWEGLTLSGMTGGGQKSGRTTPPPPPRRPAPSKGMVASIGEWFRGYWADDIDNNAPMLLFLGMPIVFILLGLMWKWLVYAAIIMLFFEKTRMWLLGLGYLCFWPFAKLLRWVFYNGWTLFFTVLLAIGVLV